MLYHILILKEFFRRYSVKNKFQQKVSRVRREKSFKASHTSKNFFSQPNSTFSFRKQTFNYWKPFFRNQKQENSRKTHKSMKGFILQMTFLSDRLGQKFPTVSRLFLLPCHSLKSSFLLFTIFLLLKNAEAKYGLLIFRNEFSRLLLNLLFLMDPLCLFVHHILIRLRAFRSCFIFLMAFMYLIF